MFKSGFVAAYNNKDRTLGFLGTDDGPRGSGYPTFESEPDRAHIYDDILKAEKDVKTITGSMTNYYGHNKIDFGSVRVVRFITTIEEVPDRDKAIHDQLVTNATDKLSDEELTALRLELINQPAPVVHGDPKRA